MVKTPRSPTAFHNCKVSVADVPCMSARKEPFPSRAAPTFPSCRVPEQGVMVMSQRDPEETPAIFKPLGHQSSAP